MRFLKVLYLRARAWCLEGQVAHGELLVVEHRARLAACYKELRRVRGRLALYESPQRMLKEAINGR